MEPRPKRKNEKKNSECSPFLLVHPNCILSCYKFECSDYTSGDNPFRYFDSVEKTPSFTTPLLSQAMGIVKEILLAPYSITQVLAQLIFQKDLTNYNEKKTIPGRQVPSPRLQPRCRLLRLLVGIGIAHKRLNRKTKWEQVFRDDFEDTGLWFRDW